MAVHTTHFAPPERAEITSILKDHGKLVDDSILNHVTNTIPSILLVLNTQRQAVYVNMRLLDFLGLSTDQDIIGKRPGEILNCIHAWENAPGCGTSRFCRDCGAVRAILRSQRSNQQVHDECRIITTTGEALDLRVWASPLNYDDVGFTVFTVLDIENEKRREALEHTFFHDVNNILAGILGHSEMLPGLSSRAEVADSADSIHSAVQELVAEIDSQRKLLEAEDDRLALRVEHDIHAIQVLRNLQRSGSKWWPETAIRISPEASDFTFSTDPSILNRILFNMMKNAAEDSGKKSPVTLNCCLKGKSGVFSIHNRGYMLPAVQHQVFQRSFSTKGRGRGTGAYSMKLFGERYLGGSVWFTSTIDQGTTFSFSLPVIFPAV